MNNKGQTLVLFVLLFPVLFLVVFLLINYGKISNEKSKVKNNISYSIRYGLGLFKNSEDVDDSYVEKQVNYILNKNLDSKHSKSVKVINSEIYIIVDYKVDNFVELKGLNSFTCSMSGKIIDGNIFIEGC